MTTTIIETTLAKVVYENGQYWVDLPRETIMLKHNNPIHSIIIALLRQKDKETETIKEFLTEMKTQKCLCTAFPFYYTIRDYDYVLAANAEDSKQVRYFNEFHDEVDKDEYDEGEGHYKCYYKEIEVKKGVFFTESDAKEHLKENQHHYTDRAHLYIEHAWRAPKLKAFFEALFEHFEIKGENKE